MAQDFKMMLPLVDGHGNVGSIDGDGAAAMRYCLTGDTLINTNNGLIKIENIIKNSELNSDNDINIQVKSMNEKNNIASKLFNSGIHDIKEINLDNGMSIKGTLNHPLLILNKDFELQWKLMDDLKVGDKCVVDISKKNQLFGNNNDLLEASMLGCMLSEGYITTQNRIGINNLDKNMIMPVKEFFERETTCNANINIRKDGCFEYTICSQKYFKEFVEKYNYKTKANNKVIPHQVFEGTKKYQQIFIKYLFEGDGSVSYNNSAFISSDKISLQYSSYSKKLVQDLQILLLTQFSIFSSIYHMKKKNEYKLVISSKSIYLFRENIGFISDKKNKILKSIPFVKIANNSYYNSIELNTFIKKKDNKIKRNIFNINDLLRFKNDLKLEIFEYCFNLMSNYLFIPIKEINEVEPEIVYSLKVESDCHSFVGNGFINHNTEARLSEAGELMCEDLHKEIVKFVPNFDETEEEPTVLPCKFPNFLLNGTTGIAVGMKTDVPSHNLKELLDAARLLLKKPNSTIPELLEFIKGPDFCTGGIIINQNELQSIYESGEGKVTIQSKIDIEEANYGKKNLIIKEIPYTMTGRKSSLIEHLVQLTQTRVLSELSDIRDESNKDEIRIVLEVKKDVNINNLLKKLYSKTNLQDNLSVKMLVLHNEIPKVLNLKEYLEIYLDFQKELIINKTKLQLKKAKARLEIVEGLLKAIDNIDTIVAVIRTSKNVTTAKNCLMTGDISGTSKLLVKYQAIAKKFNFTAVQAQAILDMKLQKLIGLEIVTFEKEKTDLLKEISRCEKIINIKSELNKILNKQFDMLEKFATKRKTKIINKTVEKYIEKEIISDVKVVVDRFLYVKSVDANTEINNMKYIIDGKTNEKLCIFTDKGNLYQIKISTLPLCKLKDKGNPLDVLAGFKEKNENILLITNENTLKNKYITFLLKSGYIKQVKFNEYISNYKRITATNLYDSEIVDVLITTRTDNVIIKTNKRELEISLNKYKVVSKSNKGFKCITFRKDEDILEVKKK